MFSALRRALAKLRQAAEASKAPPAAVAQERAMVQEAKRRSGQLPDEPGLRRHRLEAPQ